jgi:hypothetical protein
MSSGNHKRMIRHLANMDEGEPWFRFAGVSNSTAESDIAITGDYSSTEQEFSITPDPGEIWYVTHLQIFLRETGNLRAGFWGSAAALTNGIDIQMRNDGDMLKSFMGGHPVVDIGGLGAHADRIDIHEFGAGDNFMVAHWLADEQFANRPVILDSRESNYLAVIGQDDFDIATTVDQHVKFTGYKRPVPGIGL